MELRSRVVQAARALQGRGDLTEELSPCYVNPVAAEREGESEKESDGEREPTGCHLTRDSSAGSAKWQHQICAVLEGRLIAVTESLKLKYTNRLLKGGDVQRFTSWRLG